MAKSSFLMLAQQYRPAKHMIAGWFMSEKLDGMRALWDGGITRGIPKSKVPWANTAKDYRLKEEPISTGLWSRYGGVIYAPDWWLDNMPPFILDGELFTNRSDRQNLMSIVKNFNPSKDWEQVDYYVFDCPHPLSVFNTRKIDEVNFKKIISHEEIMPMYNDYEHPFEYRGVFRNKYKLLPGLLKDYRPIFHKQIELSYKCDDAIETYQSYLDDVTNNHGEGVMLRGPNSRWEPCRSYALLKAKKWQDAEGTVVGYTTGRQTDKGSKLLGMMGALIVKYHGRRLELSGFTDEERQLSNPEWAAKHPGVEVPDQIYNPQFPRGTVVTFKYRDLSRDGIPQEARYWRKHE